jgi:hypothetical protein
MQVFPMKVPSACESTSPQRFWGMWSTRESMVRAGYRHYGGALVARFS